MVLLNTRVPFFEIPSVRNILARFIMGACDSVCGRNMPAGNIRIGRAKKLELGNEGLAMRQGLEILPREIVELIIVYARELEIYFPPRKKPIAIQYLDCNKSVYNKFTFSAIDMSELRCVLMTRNNSLYCEIKVKNAQIDTHSMVKIWSRVLIEYNKISDREYFQSNVTLCALEMNSTIFARPWRDALVLEIKSGCGKWLKGIEDVIDELFDSMHYSWMVKMTCSW